MFLPPAAVSSGQRIVVAPFFVIEADVGRAALRVLPNPRTAATLPTTSATSATSATSTALSEASLRDLYPPSIGLVLSIDSWLVTLGMPTGATATEELLAGIVSAQSEPYGWNAVVRPALLYTDVYRHNASTITLTLPQLAAYEISAPETINCNLPASVLASHQPTVASPSLVIEAVGGAARVHGAMLYALHEAAHIHTHHTCTHCGRSHIDT